MNPLFAHLSKRPAVLAILQLDAVIDLLFSRSRRRVNGNLIPFNGFYRPRPRKVTRHIVAANNLIKKTAEADGSIQIKSREKHAAHSFRDTSLIGVRWKGGGAEEVEGAKCCLV